VHIDLASGQMIDTGMEFSFHLPGQGIVLGQAGRLTLAADFSNLAFVGMSVLNPKHSARRSRREVDVEARPSTRKARAPWGPVSTSR
jgi:hypothetical protein